MELTPHPLHIVIPDVLTLVDYAPMIMMTIPSVIEIFELELGLGPGGNIIYSRLDIN